MSAMQKLADFLKKEVPLFYTNSSTGQLMAFSDLEKTVTPLKNAVLEYFLRPGDIVIMNAEKDRALEHIPNGTFGIVTGYFRYRRSVGHHELWCSPKKGVDGGIPGVFEKNGAAQIAWINGSISQGHAGDIYNITDDTGHRREGAAKFQLEYEIAEFIGNLPDLKIWPGDVVETNVPFYSDPGSSGETCQVEVGSIDYDNHKTFCADGTTPYPIYQIRPMYETGPTTQVREYIEAHANDLLRTLIKDELYITKLISRGNYWKWFHDKETLKFASFRDEIYFYRSLGLSTQLPSPSGGYSWTRAEVDKAIRNKERIFIEKGSGNRLSVWDISAIPGIVGSSDYSKKDRND